MDSPIRIDNDDSDDEDSFMNFLNSLSPLKPVKYKYRGGLDDIYHPLNISSPPSIFSSPRVNWESPSSIWHQSPDPSNFKFALQNEDTTCCNEEVSGQQYGNSAELQDNFDPGAFLTEEANVETPEKQLKNVTEMPIKLMCLDGNAAPTDTATKLAGTQKALVPVLCRTSETVSEDNLPLQEMCQTVQEVQGMPADWDLRSIPQDLFMFRSPNNAETFNSLMQKHSESKKYIGASNMSRYSQHSLQTSQTTYSSNAALSYRDFPMWFAVQDTQIRHQLAEQASGSFIEEECNPTIPKKKRRKGEAAGGLQTGKRCTCKKSKCSKLYCDCFVAGGYCTESCSCQNCLNKPINEDTLLATREQIVSRDPIAFLPKLTRASDVTSATGGEPSNTPASARYKRGCNCRKSNCVKRYCECYQAGVGFSFNCRCEGCKNAFGRREESGSRERIKIDQSLQKTEIQETEEHSMAFAHAKTPLQLRRPLVQLPCSSNFLHRQPEFENQLQSAPEDEMPDILDENCPPRRVKTASPNSKRVSPPISDSKSSPARPVRRELILQSIPSSPSRTLRKLKRYIRESGKN